jgi:hypothetical protein
MKHEASEKSEDFLKLKNFAIDAISGIRAGLDQRQMLLLGPDAVEPLMENWTKLERLVCAAKLAIIREEFRARFPQFSEETEKFTFEIADKVTEKYEQLLKARNPDDLFQIAKKIAEDGFGQNFDNISGVTRFISNLTQTLQSYCRAIEAEMLPIAQSLASLEAKRS